SRASMCAAHLRPPTLSLLPYTTLFRSNGSPGPHIIVDTHDLAALERIQDDPPGRPGPRSILTLKRELFYLGEVDEIWSTSYSERSEEHTSELQSRENLVCRLLLEKKNS